METQEAAERWVATWAKAWPAKDPQAIAALYVEGAPYRAHPFRDPEAGSALGYTGRQFEVEDVVVCRFGTPIVGGDRAAVEWWASWIEGGKELTLAGVALLRFDDDGRVTEHVEYWNEAEGRLAPFAGWGRPPGPA